MKQNVEPVEELVEEELVDEEVDASEEEEDAKPPNPIVELAIQDAKELANGALLATATGVSAVCRWLGVGAGTFELGAKHAAKSAGDIAKKLEKSRRQIKL